MSKNLIIGIATGVAAVVVIGIIVKKTGILDSLLDKISDLSDSVEDRFSDFEDLIPKGEGKNVSKTLTNK